jgi:hypothetical protein
MVKTDPGYGPAPGHMGTGTVVAVLCSRQPELDGREGAVMHLALS